MVFTDNIKDLNQIKGQLEEFGAELVPAIVPIEGPKTLPTDDVDFLEHGADNRLHVFMKDNVTVHTYRDTKAVIFGSKILTIG